MSEHVKAPADQFGRSNAAIRYKLAGTRAVPGESGPRAHPERNTSTTTTQQREQQRQK